jgi:GNAT superfamily N-acetyltransferase
VSRRLEALADDHDLETFRCGRRALDDWLHQHARHATGQGTRTYVLVEERTREVVGYFAIAPHLLAASDAPKSIGRGASGRIPAILLAKLALQEPLHGTGLGAELLVHALTTIVNVARSAGGRIVVVDAIDDRAASFYQQHDFRPLPSDKRRLFMKLSSAARALELPWP